MYNSKLIQIYSVLDRQEKALLKKWVKSPAHNRHKEVSLLFDFIYTRRTISHRNSCKTKAFSYIYPDKVYNDLKMRHLMNLSVNVLENFVQFIVQEKDFFSKEKNLIQFYNNRKLTKLAQQHIQKIKAYQETVTTQDGLYYYQQYQLEQEIFDQVGEERVRVTNLQAAFDAYSTAFIIDILRHACTALTYQNLNKKNHYKIPFLAYILEEIELGKYEEIIPIQFYYNCYLSLTKPNQAVYYQKLKKLLFQNNESLAAREIRNIHLIALNFCIKQLNTGDEIYVQEVFDLFQYGLKYNILIRNGILSRFTYKNIVTAALRLNKIDWTANFLAMYTQHLEVKYQKNYQHFAHAKLLYTKGKYAQTMDLLQQVEYDDLFLNIDAKMILVKIYYEQRLNDLLDSLLNSFYVYLQRKEIMGYHQNNYKNIIKFTRKLLYQASHDTNSLNKLKEQIETTNPLTERLWLLAKVEALKKAHY